MSGGEPGRFSIKKSLWLSQRSARRQHSFACTLRRWDCIAPSGLMPSKKPAQVLLRFVVVTVFPTKAQKVTAVTCAKLLMHFF